MQGRLFDRQRQVTQLHWGGGTPTFFSDSQMADLMTHTSKNFNLVNDDQGEYSIEIDPREADANTIRHLRNMGFNRMSLGVQDFDARVQLAVNRVQSLSETTTVVDAARDCGFRSINIDLIYGLPLQTVNSFAQTLKIVLEEIRPDRISVFNYAHLPARFKTQKQINEADLPSPEEKLNILQHTIEAFADAGYVHIGMDHFALPDDELTQAQQQGRLYRNFQGYSTHADCDLVGLGVSAIGRVGSCYCQNAHSIDDYTSAIDENRLAITRGITLNKDDEIRRSVITELICHNELQYNRIEQRYGVTFSEYFADELRSMQSLVDDGLVTIGSENMQLTPVGRLLVRNVCMQFDYYRRAQGRDQNFSRAI